MDISAKTPRVASVVAFVLAGLAMLSALTGQIVLAPFAVIPLLAGIGILRKHVWSAYGMALYLFAQAFVVLLELLRSGGQSTRLWEITTAMVLNAAMIALFFAAGRSLSAAGSTRGWASPWITVSALFTVPFLFFQPFVIPNTSMADTLLVGDRILVRRLPKAPIARGDVIVFAYPPDRRQTFVKRVIGVSGDRIRICEKVLYRNGIALTERYAVHKTEYVDSYRDNFPSEPNFPLSVPGREMLRNHVVNGEVVVPEGRYFVLGDNRDSSLDSRYWGFVGVADFIGKPVLIYGSEEQSAEEAMNGKPAGPHRVRWARIFKLL
jgi:signal peptidase I